MNFKLLSTLKRKDIFFSFVFKFLSNIINIKHLQKWRDVFFPWITEFCRRKHTLLCPQPLKFQFRRMYCCFWSTAVWILILQSPKDSQKGGTTCKWNCPTDFRATATSQLVILTASTSPPLYNVGPCLGSVVQTVGKLFSSHILNPHFSGKINNLFLWNQYKTQYFLHWFYERNLQKRMNRFKNICLWGK